MALASGGLATYCCPRGPHRRATVAGLRLVGGTVRSSQDAKAILSHRCRRSKQYLRDVSAPAANHNRMPEAIIGAVHEQPAHAALAQLGEGDFGRAVGHGPDHSADQATSEAATSCCPLNRPVRSIRLSGAM